MTLKSLLELPPELRWQIWADALPDNVPPALCFYKERCWEPAECIHSYADYHGLEYGDIHVAFNDKLLDPVKVDIPFASVDLAAYDVASRWANQHNVRKHTTERGELVFASHFNPQRDALYISSQDFDGFLAQCISRRRRYDPDSLVNEEIYSYSNVRCLAVAETVLPGQFNGGLAYFLHDYFNQLNELWWVIGEQPVEVQTKAENQAINERWTVEDIEDETTVRLIREKLDMWSVQPAVRNIRIRPVRAVRAG